MHQITAIIADSYQSLAQFLVSGGYWFLGIIVVLEGLPIIGSFLPGHVVIMAAGFLAKIGVFNLGIVITIVIITAIIGDILGFLLGRRYGYAFLQRFGKFIFIKEEHMEKAKALIDNHTGKAIIFGKFSPVTRPLTPFLVGASGVHIKTFWFFNIIGAVLWAVSSVMIGYIFGASYHAVTVYLGKFIVIAIISTILIIWGYRFINSRFHIFRKYELFVLGLNLISLWALAKTVQDSVSANSFMANFDISVNLFMLQHVTPAIASIWGIVTNIGSTGVMIALGLTIGLTFMFKKKWRRASIMLVSILATSVVVTIMKEVFMRARPDDALKILSDPSFPSGHAALSAAFFLASAYIFSQNIHSWIKREVFIVFCVSAVILIGLSRVILNVHWASDVIAGWSLGVFITTASILFVRYVGTFFINLNNRP